MQVSHAFRVEPDVVAVYPATIAYLAVPSLLFLLGFVKPAIGIPLAVLLVLATVAALGYRPVPRPHAMPVAFASLALAVLVLLIAGFPYGPFAWDWIKHWALIDLLGSAPWPPVVELQGRPDVLRFYVGAYLVPAALHKVVPALPLWATTGAWFGLGIALVLQIGSLPLRSRPLAACIAGMAALLLPAGADFFGENIIRLVGLRPIGDWFGIHYENWFDDETGLALQFTSTLGALLWVPHQAIATFLVAALLATDRAAGSLGRMLLCFGLLALWSPYGMVGLLPLVIFRTVEARRDALRLHSVALALVGGAIALVVASYLATSAPTNGMCVTCAVPRLLEFPRYLPFLVVELAFFGLILWRKRTDAGVLVPMLTLVAIPLFHGETADFVMRGSMGPLFILGMRSIEALAGWSTSVRRERWRYAAAIVLCAPTVVSEIAFHVTHGAAHERTAIGDPLHARWYRVFAPSSDIGVTQFFELCGWKVAPQYFTTQWPAVLRHDR